MGKKSTIRSGIVRLGKKNTQVALWDKQQKDTDINGTGGTLGGRTQRWHSGAFWHSERKDTAFSYTAAEWQENTEVAQCYNGGKETFEVALYNNK